MRYIMKILVLLYILPILLITGCISGKTAISDHEKVQYYRPPAISNETLDRRINNIKTLLEENNLSDDRKETAVSILKAYDKIKSLDQENFTVFLYSFSVRFS